MTDIANGKITAIKAIRNNTMGNNVDELFKHLDFKKYPALKSFIETFGSQPPTVPTTLEEKRKIAEKAKQEIASTQERISHIQDEKDTRASKQKRVAQLSSTESQAGKRVFEIDNAIDKEVQAGRGDSKKVEELKG